MGNEKLEAENKAREVWQIHPIPGFATVDRIPQRAPRPRLVFVVGITDVSGIKGYA